MTEKCRDLLSTVVPFVLLSNPSNKQICAYLQRRIFKVLRFLSIGLFAKIFVNHKDSKTDDQAFE